MPTTETIRPTLAPDLRSRIVGHSMEAPDQLLANPQNFRRHPAKQRDALRANLATLGFVKSVLVNRTTGHVIDGHARVEECLRSGTLVPVEWVDLTHDEEKQALATLDPITGMAVQDDTALRALLDDFKVSDKDLAKMLDSMAKDAVPVTSGALQERFIVPPFTVLDARAGYWQERKRAWLGLGLDPAAGREHLRPSANASAGDYDYMTGRGADTGGSSFDPVLAELVCRWFCPPGGAVLDPFAGEAVKGIVAARCGLQYVGVELRPDQVAVNQQQALAIGVAPTWLVGDSANLDAVVAPDPVFDLMFTSPPYYDLEIYSAKEKDGSAFATYQGFDAWHRGIIAACAARLRDDRFIVIKVGEVRDEHGAERNFVGDTITNAQQAGLALYSHAILLTPLGTAPIRASAQFAKGRKLTRAHQHVLVFFKGDTSKVSTTHAYDVEVGDGPDDPAPVA